MKRSKWLAATLASVVMLAVFASDTYAKKSHSGGSSRPSSHSSSRPSSHSSSLFGGSYSKPSGGSSKPSSGSSSLFGGSSKPSSRPNFGSPNTGSSKPSTGSTKDSGPKFGSPSTKPNAGTPKFGSPNTISNPGQVPSTRNSPLTSSTKPKTTGGGSAKAQDQKREEGRKFVETKKATTPPKSEAVVNGQKVRVDSGSRYVTDVRSRPSTYIAPAARRTRYETHVIRYHYSHPYDYYYGRSVSYGIGPYNNAFWWMMMEWSAERRAQWAYNHRAELSQEAYSDLLRDQEVQRRLAVLETQKVARNVSYVDPEFANDPTDVLDQNYIEAAYNPPVQPGYTQQSYNGPSAGRVLGVMFGIAFLIGSVYVIYLIVTKVKVSD